MTSIVMAGIGGYIIGVIVALSLAKAAATYSPNDEEE